MSPDVDIYTETMAKVYADQGHWAKAAEIYRHLAQLEPERQDLSDALEHARQMMEGSPDANPEELVPLFRKSTGLFFRPKDAVPYTVVKKTSR